MVFRGHCSPVLGLDNPSVVPGQIVRFSISEAGPNSYAFLFIRSVDGVPFQLPVARGPIPGILCLQAIVPNTRGRTEPPPRIGRDSRCG